MPPLHSVLEIVVKDVTTIRAGDNKMKVLLGCDAKANKHPVFESEDALQLINGRTAAAFCRTSLTSEWMIASQAGGGSIFLVDDHGKTVNMLASGAQPIRAVHGMRFWLLDQNLLKSKEYQVVLRKEAMHATPSNLELPKLPLSRPDVPPPEDVCKDWHDAMGKIVRQRNAKIEKRRTMDIPPWQDLAEAAAPAGKRKACKRKGAQ